MMKKNCSRAAPIDRISNLPDELLCHIISFLPTKFAFSSTIILSKRWTQLFKLLTTFNLDDEDLQSEDNFLRFLAFIDKITLSTHRIETIHFNIRSMHRRGFNIHRWIESAKRHPVENLHLLCSYTHKKKLIIPLPSTIFTLFPTLVVLKLAMLIVPDEISLVHLPRLKTLHLNNVYFKNKHSFNNLLYQCPVLEDLVAARIFYREKDEEETEGGGGGEFKSLSNLNAAHMDLINSPHVPFRAICNVQILKLTMAAMLSGFRLFQNLINLNLSFYNFKDWDDLLEILRYCPKLQIMQLIKCANNTHMSISWKYPNSVPQCISSHLKSCTIDYEGFEDELRFTKYILQNAPFLELMKINQIHSLQYQRHTLQQLYSCPRISTQCKLSILEPIISQTKIRYIF